MPASSAAVHGLVVEVGLGADEHGVDVVARKQRPPIAQRVRDAELGGDALGAGEAAVGDRDDLDAVEREEVGEQAAAGEAARADDADADCLRHAPSRL